MRPRLLVALLALTTPALAARPDATASDGSFSVTVIDTGKGDADTGDGTQALVLDRPNTPRRVLLVSKFAPTLGPDLTNLSDPVVSLDNGYVYFNTSREGPASGVVHQVAVRTGRVREVTNGMVLGIIRTDPLRGYLIVQRHEYYDRPEGGSYNPVDVVRPDGVRKLRIPGSATDDGEAAIAPWLKRQGWHAW